MATLGLYILTNCDYECAYDIKHCNILTTKSNVSTIHLSYTSYYPCVPDGGRYTFTLWYTHAAFINTISILIAVVSIIYYDCADRGKRQAQDFQTLGPTDQASVQHLVRLPA